MLATKFGTIPAQSAVWLAGWAYGKEMTIPADSIDADLSNIPLAVYLRDTAAGSIPANFDFTQCRWDGYDIRFTDAALNLLKFERVEHGTPITYTADLCTGGTPIKSSEYSTEFGAAKAFDDATATYWRCNTTGAGSWLGYDFGSAKRIRRIKYYTASSTSYNPTKVSISYSDDGTNWTDGAQITVANTVSSWVTVAVAASYGNHRYWRLVQGDALYWRVHEMEMYAASSQIARYNIKVPTVSNLTDTKLYMWWGNANAYNASVEAWQDMTGKAATYYLQAKLAYNATLGRRALAVDGTEDAVSYADSADFSLGAGEFCVEAIFNTAGADLRDYILGQGNSGATSDHSFFASMQINDGLKFQVSNGSSVYNVTSATGISTGAFHHFAALREGNTLKMYIDGVLQAATADLTGVTISDNQYAFSVGRLGTYLTGTFAGVIGGCRITKGSCRYTGAFTPPTEFEIDSSSVVFCSNFDTVYDSNYVMVQHLGDSLVDASGNNNSGTAIGTTVVDTDYGKIRQFNGTSDYVSCPSAAAITGDNPYTIVALADNTTGNAYSQNIIGWGDGATANKNTCMQVVNGTYKLRTSWWAPDLDAATTLTLGTYYALAIKYDQTTRKNLVNGVVDGTDTPADHAAVTTRNYIGCVPKTTRDSYWYGYIGEVRVSNIARSDAWIKAESLALKNSLITMTDLD